MKKILSLLAKMTVITPQRRATSARAAIVRFTLITSDVGRSTPQCKAMIPHISAKRIAPAML